MPRLYVSIRKTKMIDHDCVFFNRLVNSNSSIRHAGDNRTGAGAGDDEQIFISLKTVPPEVQSILLIVNSYSGHPLSLIKNAYIRVLRDGAGSSSATELIRFQLNGTGSGSDTALLMARMYRSMGAQEWRMKAIGHGTKGRAYADNVGEMQRELAGRLQSTGAAGFRFQPEFQGRANREGAVCSCVIS